MLARFNTILMRGKIEEFSPLENISKTNLIFFKEKEYCGHFDFILPETFFGHIIHSVNDPAVLTHSGKYQWINPINDHLTTPLISAIRIFLRWFHKVIIILFDDHWSVSITWSSYCFILIIYWSRFWKPVQYFVGAGQLTPCANVVHLTMRMMRMMRITMARIHPEQWWYCQIMVMATRIRKMVTLSENETSIASLPPSLWNPGAHSHSSRIWKLIFAHHRNIFLMLVFINCNAI